MTDSTTGARRDAYEEIVSLIEEIHSFVENVAEAVA
jgi:hypothetical protein